MILEQIVFALALFALGLSFMAFVKAFPKIRVILKLPGFLIKRFRRSTRPLAESVFAVLIGLLVGALLMAAFGHNPIRGYISMLKGFGLYIEEGYFRATEFAEMLAFATPLMLTAITFAVGMKAGLFNIGAEGQVYVGAAAAALIAGHFALPAGLHLFAATAIAMLAGAFWALLPALLKLWKGVHEVISTIMLNWIAFHLVTYLVIYHLAGVLAERTATALPTARYAVLMEGSTLTTVIFVAIAFCIGVYILLWRTRIGYELRLAGDNPDAARYAGISLRRAMLVSFVIGGMAAGLAGASQVIGRPPAWSLYATLGTVATLGFTGIGIALVGRNHPIGGIFAAIFFAGVVHGGRFMEYDWGISSELVVAIQGVFVIALAIPALLSIIRRRPK